MELIKSFVGAFCISALTFILPATFELATFWKSTEAGGRRRLIARTTALAFIGLLAMTFGSIKTIYKITETED